MKNLRTYSGKRISRASRISKQIFSIFYRSDSIYSNVNIFFCQKTMFYDLFLSYFDPKCIWNWIFILIGDRSHKNSAFAKNRVSISSSYLKLEPVIGRKLVFLLQAGRDNELFWPLPVLQIKKLFLQVRIR